LISYYIEYRKYYNHHFLPNYWLPKWYKDVNNPSGRVIPAFDETQETLNKVCKIEDKIYNYIIINFSLLIYRTS
jgi:hypothetical protein